MRSFRSPLARFCFCTDALMEPVVAEGLKKAG